MLNSLQMIVMFSYSATTGVEDSILMIMMVRLHGRSIQFKRTIEIFNVCIPEVIDGNNNYCVLRSSSNLTINALSSISSDHNNGTDYQCI